MINRRRLLKLSAAATLAPGIACPAIAQAAWPNKPVRILIPFTPGGGADTIARFVALKMTEVLGQQFIVESKPGAGGNIAAEFTARSAPDGYTMFLAGDHHATNIFLNPNLSYHPVNDFEPVSLVVQYPVAMAIPNNSPDKTLADFIARAKAEPGKLTFGSPGHGAVPHLSAELFVRAARHPDDPRALSRRGAGHPGSDPRANQFLLQQHRADGAAVEPGPDASAGRHHGEAWPRWRPTCRPWRRRCPATT